MLLLDVLLIFIGVPLVVLGVADAILHAFIYPFISKRAINYSAFDACIWRLVNQCELRRKNNHALYNLLFDDVWNQLNQDQPGRLPIIIYPALQIPDVVPCPNLHEKLRNGIAHQNYYNKNEFINTKEYTRLCEFLQFSPDRPPNAVALHLDITTHIGTTPAPNDNIAIWNIYEQHGHDRLKFILLLNKQILSKVVNGFCFLDTADDVRFILFLYMLLMTYIAFTHIRVWRDEVGRDLTNEELDFRAHLKIASWLPLCKTIVSIRKRFTTYKYAFYLMAFIIFICSRPNEFVHMANSIYTVSNHIVQIGMDWYLEARVTL